MISKDILNIINLLSDAKKNLLTIEDILKTYYYEEDTDIMYHHNEAETYVMHALTELYFVHSRVCLQELNKELNREKNNNI